MIMEFSYAQRFFGKEEYMYFLLRHKSLLIMLSIVIAIMAQPAEAIDVTYSSANELVIKMIGNSDITISNAQVQSSNIFNYISGMNYLPSDSDHDALIPR